VDNSGVFGWVEFWSKAGQKKEKKENPGMS
jgi:hypothetical protein